MSNPTSVDVVNNALADSAPSMQVALDNTVTLIRGLWSTHSEKFETFATVKELTGADEEFLASFDARPNTTYGEYLSAVLSRSVISIGGIQIKSSKDLDSLIVGDRDLLFLQAVRTTYGTERTVQVLCNACRKKNDVVIELDKDFPSKLPDFNVFEPLTVEGKYTSYRFSIPTLADLNAAAVAKSPAESNTIVISRCAVFEDGEAPADRLAWARGINSSDRRKIIDLLLSIDLGPTLEEVDTHCAHCEKEMTVALNWVSLLLD